jgi:hypothetical protein
VLGVRNKSDQLATIGYQRMGLGLIGEFGQKPAESVSI